MMMCGFTAASILAVLTLATNHRSDCLSLPESLRSKRQNQQHHQQPPRRHRWVYRAQPALLDAIRDFSLSSYHHSDARRVFHGRGGLHPGADHLTLDYYPPVFLLTSYRHLGDDELEAYGDALWELWERNEHPNSHWSSSSRIEKYDSNSNVTPRPLAWVYQCRAQRGNSTTCIMSGEIPEPHVVTENNGRERFIVRLARGQNHGLFLDMSVGRSWLRRICATGEISSVLNLFAYTCAFSVAALNGGAEKVVNVDMSRGALKVGQRNHEANGLVRGGGAKFLGHDLFKSWGKLRRMGPYDCIVVDPPSYQKGSFVVKKDYVKVIRRLPSLLKPQGWTLLCLNAPELSSDFLLEQVRDGAPELRFVERLENPPAFASAFPERALKVLTFRLGPAPEKEGAANPID